MMCVVCCVVVVTCCLLRAVYYVLFMQCYSFVFAWRICPLPVL